MSLPVRTINRFLSKNFPAPLRRQIILSSTLINRELISSFQMYSEVQDLGKDLLKCYTHQDLRNSFVRFQSYIRQAINFYQAAEALHYRASPLLYYYSFMNFAKAITFLRDPTFPFGHIAQVR